MDIKLIVATHKNYILPHDEMYLPVYAGASVCPDEISDVVPDNTGENISFLNPYYCELTALYWAWKNLSYTHLGLMHYRRYLTLKKGDSLDCILTKEQIVELFSETDIILPKAHDYRIETNYSQYIHAHHKQDIDVVKEIIDTFYPSYKCAFETVMKQRSGHRCNLFIMDKEKADDYLSWLFSVLLRFDGMVDMHDYSDADKRAAGHIAERLLDVWIEKNGYSYKELPVYFTENQNLFARYTKFVLRKFGIKF